MKRLEATVDFSVEVPDDTTEEDIEDMTFEIPFEQMRVDGSSGLIEGARVTGYTTIHVEEVKQ